MGRTRGKFQLFRRGKIYHFRIWDSEAARYVATRSTGETNRTDAAITANRMITSGVITVGRDKPVIDYVIERVQSGQTTKKYKLEGVSMLRNMAGSVPEFSRLSIGHVKSKNLNRLVDSLESAGHTPRMINRCMQLLIKHLRDAYRSGWVESDPTIPSIRKAIERPARRGALTLEEIIKICDSQPGDDVREWCYVVTAMLTGLRKSEMRALQWIDIDYTRNLITVCKAYTSVNGTRVTKTRDSERMVAILEPVKNAFGLLYEVSPYTEPSDYIFFQRDKGRPVPDHWVEHAFHSVLDSVGINHAERERRNLVPHSLRHTFVTFARDFVSTLELMSMSGHSTSQMVDNYSHATDRQLASAKIKLDEALRSKRIN